MMRRAHSSKIEERNLISGTNPTFLKKKTKLSQDLYLVLDLHYDKKMGVT